MQFGQNMQLREKEADNLCHGLGAVAIDSNAKNKFERRHKNNAVLGNKHSSGEAGAERGG